MNKEALIKALLEMGRIALLACIPIVLQALLANQVDWRSVGVAVAIAVLKAIDQYLHKLGGINGNKRLAKGLTSF